MLGSVAYLKEFSGMEINGMDGQTGVWPNFFIVGAAKAGTTSLHALLRAHRDAGDRAAENTAGETGAVGCQAVASRRSTDPGETDAGPRKR